MSGTIQRTETDLAALKVARRVEGDLLSILEKLDMSSATDINDLVHDLRIGIAEDCIETLNVFLYEKGAGYHDARRAYAYRRVDRGNFTESAHSGRIAWDSALAGGRIEFQVWPRDRASWESLKASGKLRINWTPCKDRSTAGMTASADGGYGSGSIGLSRTCYTRNT